MIFGSQSAERLSCRVALSNVIRAMGTSLAGNTRRAADAPLAVLRRRESKGERGLPPEGVSVDLSGRGFTTWE